MKTLDQVIADYESKAIDGRDFTRLAAFVPANQLDAIGCALPPGTTHTPLPFTRENVLAQLQQDVAFGFEKALDKRGISANCMYYVVAMWNWVLEEGLGLDNFEGGYAQYGLPLFKATAVKYGWPNPIGDDTGSEYRYSAEADEPYED